MKVKVYADRRISSPARAVLIFCKVNEIDFEEVKLELSKRQHLTPEYAEINPMRQVPSIVDGGFKLFESHAILKYLASAFPGVAENWYPADLSRRAKIDSLLDWHLSNLRLGSVIFFRNSTLAPIIGRPVNLQAAAEGEKLFSESLAKLESFWLKGTGKFLLGGSQPSIADLSLVCDVMLLELVDEEDRNTILSPYKKVVKWVDDTKNVMNPHFDEIHSAFFKLQEMLQKQRGEGRNSARQGCGVRSKM